jgi:hypothetical protein
VISPSTENSLDPLSQKITIDVCQLYGSDTIFLQQAAHLTGGSYIFLERRDALLQYLIVSNTISDMEPVLLRLS